MNIPVSSPGQLLRFAVQCCRLRGGPQDIAHSPALLIGLIAASLVLDQLIGNLIDFKGPLLGRSLLSMVLLLGLSWTALTMRGLQHRYVQTASTLVLCAMAFSVLILPVSLLFGSAPSEEVPLNATQMLMAWLGLGIVAWKVCVDAHIVRQAIDAPFSLGVMLALSWAIADWALGQAIFSGAT